MSDSTAKNRPEFRNVGFADLANYKLPLAGKVSILHRISGVVLFFAIPLVLLPLLAISLSSPQQFESLSGLTSNIIVKIILLGIIWSYCHHFCAGIRFLLIDVHMGVDKYKSCKTAGSVIAISLVLTVIFGLKLFGVF